MWKIRYNSICSLNKKVNVMLMRIGVMAAQQTLTLLVEVRVLYP